MSKKKTTADDLAEFDPSIDKHRLDEEWENQPVLIHFYADLLADARYNMDQAKSVMKATEAELGQDIRSSPLEFGIDKITEGVVTGTILQQPEFKDAEQTYLQAKRRVDKLVAIVDSLDHRKKALESLVYLHGQSYFGEPSARRAGQTGMDKMNQPPRAKGIRTKKDSE